METVTEATGEPADPASDGTRRAPRVDPGVLAETLRAMTSTAIVLGATLIVLSIVHPDLVLRVNTPTGGDMGAHVWGPAYLRDVLLPHWRLSGWSMDWYAGFPAYRFYMVVPALAILLLDVALPYGVAFKIVVVAGLLAFPACAWLMGRFAGLAYPLPELMCVGALLFLLDESYTIYGGNIPSTMAGEFSFSISLALSLLALGLFARGLEDGSRRATAAVLVALAALSHGIVLLFVFGGAVVMALLRADLRRVRWAAVVLGTAVLLSAFWVLPFLGGHAYMTDMKYEPRPSGASDSLWDMFFPLPGVFDGIIVVLALAGFVGSVVRRRFLGIWMGVMVLVLMVGVQVAQQSLPVIGLLWNPRILPFLYLLRYMLAAVGVHDLITWVVRSVTLERGPRDRNGAMNLATASAWAMALPCLLVIGFRYQAVPGAGFSVADGRTMYGWGPLSVPAHRAFSDGWARWNFEGYEGKAAYPEYHDLVETMRGLGEDPAHGCGRALWENNSENNKYGTTMALMLLPHWTRGCIASMEGLFFEASGTTPYHFIAAAAVSRQSSNPVRELRYDNNVGELGESYMRALGVRYLMVFTPEAVAEASARAGLVQVAESGPWRVFEIVDTALVEPLAAEPVVVLDRPGDRRERWLEVGTSWFQRRDEWPALPVDDGPSEWDRIAVSVDLDRRIGEPGERGRQVDIVVPPAGTVAAPLPEVVVSDVVLEDERISFRVDRTGVPVLVKVSWFPAWDAEGAQGPWRAAPNFMVVVPTDNEVVLSYGRPAVDGWSWALTLAGVAGAVAMGRRRHRFGTAAPPRTEPTGSGDDGAGIASSPDDQ